MFAENEETGAAHNTHNNAAQVVNQHMFDMQAAEPVEPEVFEEAEHFFDEAEEEERVANKPRKQRKKGENTKKKWTEEEEKEIKTILKKCFEKKRGQLLKCARRQFK